MSERWRPIVGWEGRYEVSDHGRVRGVDRLVPRGNHFMPIRGCVLRQKVDSTGRPVVDLHAGAERQTLRVHRAVLEAFVGLRPAGLVGCHNDGDCLNNHLSNLRWDTYASNLADAVRHGAHGQTKKVCCPKGHPLSGENLVLQAGKAGRQWRRCRTCRRTAALARYHAIRRAAA